MTLSGKMIDTYGESGDEIGEFDGPFSYAIFMCDCDSNLLVADQLNNRLQLLHGRQWSVLQLQPQPFQPCNAVYYGNALYVVQWNPHVLAKYK